MSEYNEYPWWDDFIWAATDVNGNVAIFFTGGSGPIPEYWLRMSTHNINVLIRNLLPDEGNTEVIPLEGGCEIDWKFASRGVYVYDWQYEQQGDGKNYGYSLVSIPKCPVLIASLNQDLALSICNVKFGSDFSDVNLLDPYVYCGCIDKSN